MNQKSNIMKPKKESFKLSKVKLIKDGGLDCHFEVEEVSGQEVYLEKYHTESSKDLHPDLSSKFLELKPILARIYHLSFFRDIIQKPDFKATAKQSQFAEKFYQEILSRINVTGVAISGQDKNEGIIITGTFKADTNQIMAINSHRIRFVDTKYGFEENLEILVDEIKEEVFAFLFENKRAQLSLFDQPEATKTEKIIFDGKAAAAGAGNEKDDEFEENEEEIEQDENPEDGIELEETEDESPDEEEENEEQEEPEKDV